MSNGIGVAMRAVDIGWFWETKGPFTLHEMQRRWASGELDRDAEVRHALDPRSAWAGDVEEFRHSEVVAQPIPCLRHQKREAVSFCLCCWAPICRKCLVGDRNCSRCHRGLYDRRVLAACVDFVLLPFIATTLLGFSYAIKNTHEYPYYFEYSLIYGFPVLLACFVLFKDWLGSPGKWLFGLRAVNLETRLPCGPLPSIQRNALLALSLVMPLGLFYWGTSVVLAGFPVLALLELAAAFRDPMMRRPSDFWAGTRVLRTLAGVHQRRADTRLRLKAVGLKIRYPGTPPDPPESPPNSAPQAAQHPSDPPASGQEGEPPDVERATTVVDSTAEKPESTENLGL